MSKYGIDALTSSIFLRRNITDGRDILYYLEDDMRFQHSPFSFNSMEDAVDRILDAKEEGEKVLIFGDRDVDGVSSTTLLYDCFSSMGIDVSYRLPSGDDAYGLSMQAVDDFYKDNGSLIVTVDCGISNNEEVAHAAELGIDVIIVDHHNPPERLPEPAIIIDQKIKDSGYPFNDISGCAVAYKLASALRFSQSDWYKQEITLMNICYVDDEYSIDCLKVKNLVPVRQLNETVFPQSVSISKTKLPDFLAGQIIFVWDGESASRMFKDAFGDNVDFNFIDLRQEVSKIMPKMADKTLENLKTISKIAKYGNHEPSEIGSFYNIYVTYVQMMFKRQFVEYSKAEENDLQLVALAALADIMPMKDENRLFVKNGLYYINNGKTRDGLKELMARLNLLGKKVNSTDLSWVVVSHLNAAGRLGHPELAAQLFITKDPKERDKVAEKIIALNVERKQLSLDAWNYASIQASSSIGLHSNNLCVVIDERINRGVSGILAGKLVGIYDVPSLAVTFVDDTAIGSMRSCRGCNATEFLSKFSDIFINYGGHNAAAGFSFSRDRLKDFEQRLVDLSKTIKLEDSKSNCYDIDAEIPENYLTPDLLELTELFEPFGEQNNQLLFMSRSLKIVDALILGKTDKMHLKLILQAGKYKWPALFWNEGERLRRDFDIGDRVNILYRVERNTFNGIDTPQLILTDIIKCTGDL